jgi:hypothetical protein
VADIVDTLHLRREELNLIEREYPDAVITKISREIVHHVRIPVEECEDGYYIFLLKNGVALSSHNFCARVESDPRFVVRMRASIADALASKPFNNIVDGTAR